MKAVILAAGLGSRLRPITNEVPKCMVPVNGIKIIDKQINNLLVNNVTDICVVAGYKADVLIQYIRNQYPFIKIIENKRYAETNNMYSLFLTRNFIDGSEFLLMNADVYYDSDIITGLLEGSNISKIACDKTQFLEESMKITLDNGDKINHISKQISQKEHFAVSIDVYRISSEDSCRLFEYIVETILKKKDENSWTEVALDNIFPTTSFYPYIISSKWFEIDNHEDLAKAEQIFKDDALCEI